MKTTPACSKSFGLKTFAPMIAVLLTGVLLAVGCSSSTGSGSSSSSGGSSVVPETWSCGTETCKKGEVCTSERTEGQTSPTTYSCKAMPAACATNATCACLAELCSGGMTDSTATACGCDDTGCFVPCVLI